MAHPAGRLSADAARAARGVGAAAVVILLAGCGPPWHFEYQEGEIAARAAERPLVVFYKDPFDVASSHMEDLLKSGPVAKLLAGKERCLLTTEFAPHRRYVAQYGTFQAPALIVVHPDGTYHAHNGVMNLEQIQGFFAEANPPGAKPTPNPQIPRTIDVRYYRWAGNYEEALATARRQNRELLIVYKWWLSAESNDLLTILHSRPEVARHFSETVNCLLDQDYAPNRLHARRYGVATVPAMILVHRDGTYHAHSGPMSADQIVRFVAAAKGPGRTPGIDRAQRLQARTDYHWYTDFSRAQAHARHRGANLFVFFSSLYSDQSNRMARLLEQPEVAALFSDTINCRLDFSVSANRRIMARCRVRRTPAFLLIRSDGTYHARTGAVTADTLSDLVRAAQEPGLVPRPADLAP